MKLVEALEEKDKKKIPSIINNQNRNLLGTGTGITRKQFLKLFGEVVNFNAYRTHGKTLFKVAENQLLCNLEFMGFWHNAITINMIKI